MQSKPSHMFDFQEIDLCDEDFLNLKKLVYDKCGIYLHEGKKELVRSRLGKRLRETGIGCFREYYRYLMKEDAGDELAQMLDAISTNLTSFFRESNHFDYLENELLPSLFGSERPRPVRIWSAGCSSGEEPYSIAICFMEYPVRSPGWDFKILATDIAAKVLSLAAAGVYHHARIQSIPEEILRKYFQKGTGKWHGYFRIKPTIRKIIDFRRFNLVSPFVFDEKFDLIFCRNVMIYFDKTVQESLVNKFYDCLASGGHLFVGHSESLLSIRHRFQYIRPTIYRKA